MANAISVDAGLSAGAKLPRAKLSMHHIRKSRTPHRCDPCQRIIGRTLHRSGDRSRNAQRQRSFRSCPRLGRVLLGTTDNSFFRVGRGVLTARHPEWRRRQGIPHRVWVTRSSLCDQRPWMRSHACARDDKTCACAVRISGDGHASGHAALTPQAHRLSIA